MRLVSLALYFAFMIPHVMTAVTHLLPVLLDVKWKRMLSLRRFLEKLFTLHNRIVQVAQSRRLSSVLEGEFKVVLVPEAHSNIYTNCLIRMSAPSFFLPEIRKMRISS